MNLHTPLRKCWMRRGQQRRIPAASGPQGFHHIIGALNWESGQVNYRIVTVKNSQTFIEFIEQLMLTDYPDQSVVLVMDNAPYHRSAAVQAALSLFEPRLLVFWLPPYCPTLNPIERFWLHVKDKATANTLFLTIERLLDNLRTVLQAHNDADPVFRLTFSKLIA